MYVCVCVCVCVSVVGDKRMVAALEAASYDHTPWQGCYGRRNLADLLLKLLNKRPLS